MARSNADASGRTRGDDAFATLREPRLDRTGVNMGAIMPLLVVLLVYVLLLLLLVAIEVENERLESCGDMVEKGEVEGWEALGLSSDS